MKRILIALLLCSAVWAQVARDANSNYQTKEGRESVAKGLARANRDVTQRPQELIEAMGVKPGMTVADIGTGVGYMLPFMSRAVGPNGHVLAEDIFDDFLDKAKQTVAREKLGNVEFVKGAETDPNLPENSVDIALALDSYHHYNYPEKMLAGLRKGLKPGGHLVIVDYYKRPTAMPNGNAMSHIRIDAPDVIKEVEASGLKFVSQREHIKDSQYMAVFEK